MCDDKRNAAITKPDLMFCIDKEYFTIYADMIINAAKEVIILF